MSKIKKYSDFFSQELDNVVGIKSFDKKYIAKKNLLMDVYHKMLNFINNHSSALPSYETFKEKFVHNDLGKMSLKFSLYQLDSKVLSFPKYAPKVEDVHSGNIIDNITMLTPMMLLCNDTKPKKFLESIAYSNLIDSYNHRSELLIAMMEKNSGEPLTPGDKKYFKKLNYEYDIIKKSILEYL